MKKKICLFITMLIVTAPMCLCAAAETDEFSDINGHWAQAYIAELAEKGAVNGYEDGTFRPEEYVSRAELVKIAGYTEADAENIYSDINSSHWAYKYIISSGFEADENGFFQPDAPAERIFAARILYKKYGSGKIFTAADIISDQGGDYKDAVAFVYANGILNGDDGINLRLGDGLTRAEAAALTVRCGALGENSADTKFSSYIDDNILKEIFEGSALFDGEYDRGRAVTNGEAARAAVRLMSGENIVDYSKYPNYAEIFGTQGEYARETALMSGLCLGRNKATEEFASADANGGDVMLMFMYALLNRDTDTVTFAPASGNYSDAVSDGLGGRYTAAGFENNFVIYSDGSLRPNETVSAADIAALIMQIDYKYGVLCGYDVTAEKYTKIYRPLDLFAAENIEGAENYAHFVKDVPYFVYTSPFTAFNSNWSAPFANYSVASEFKEAFAKELQKFARVIKEKHGVEISCSYYPSLVYSSGEGFVMRVKFTVLKTPENLEYSKVFGKNTLQNTEKYLYDGEEFFAEIGCEYKNIQMNLTN